MCNVVLITLETLVENLYLRLGLDLCLLLGTFDFTLAFSERLEVANSV